MFLILCVVSVFSGSLGHLGTYPSWWPKSPVSTETSPTVPTGPTLSEGRSSVSPSPYPGIEEKSTAIEEHSGSVEVVTTITFETSRRSLFREVFLNK